MKKVKKALSVILSALILLSAFGVAALAGGNVLIEGKVDGFNYVLTQDMTLTINGKGTLPEELKIPHIGWNALHFTDSACPLFRYIHEGDCVYFVHSFYASGCEDSLAATAEYGLELTAAVAKGNVFGCQFHPEKSGDVGLNILRAFCETEVQA